MALWNETKVEILRQLKASPKTTDELSEALECSRSNVTAILLKLLRAGLVDRETHSDGFVALSGGKNPVKRPARIYVYHLTDVGEERLKKLEGDLK